jgi:hypothetical protein
MIGVSKYLITSKKKSMLFFRLHHKCKSLNLWWSVQHQRQWLKYDTHQLVDAMCNARRFRVASRMKVAWSMWRYESVYLIQPSSSGRCGASTFFARISYVTFTSVFACRSRQKEVVTLLLRSQNSYPAPLSDKRYGRSSTLVHAITSLLYNKIDAQGGHITSS